MTDPFSIWVYLSATPLLWLALTLVSWIVADAIGRACGRHPLVNPVLIAIAAMAAVLIATGTPYETYFQGAQFVHFLLGPATVAIAVPLVRHRTLVLAKQAHRELNQLVHPNMVRPLKVGGTIIANRVVFAVLAFVFLYFMSIVTLVFLQLASGLDFMTAFSSVIACINNAGPGLGLVGPGSNYGVLSNFQTWVCSVAMLFGRLEVFTILVLFTPTLWRK